MEKCTKTFLWIFCATVILVGLGVGIYFIIADAIDKKIEACLTKHFQEKGVFTQLNFTSPIDPAKITYTQQDCQYIVDEARNRTVVSIKSNTEFPECYKKLLQTQFLDFVLLKSVLEKKNRREDGSKVLGGILPKVKQICESQAAENGTTS